MLSDIEYKLLTVVFGVVLLFTAVRTSGWAVEAYNRHVEAVELEKKRKADGGPRISFSNCSYGRTPLFEVALFFQLPISILGFVFFRLRRQKELVVSILFLGLLLFGFGGWAYTTYIYELATEYRLDGPPPYSSYLLYNSTLLDRLTLASASVLVVLQSAVLVRYSVERACGRIGSGSLP